MSEPRWNLKLSVPLQVVLLFFVWMAIGWAQGTDRGPHRVSLTISTQETAFRVGEGIEVRVEVKNEGQQSVFLPREIRFTRGWISSFNLIVSDVNGNVSPWLEAAPPFVKPADPNESVETALSTGWIALPPGYSYGRTFGIDWGTHPFLQKPGKYELTGIYESMGMDAPVYYNRLSLNPDEIKSLPFASWKGVTKSNSIWIEIVPATGQRKKHK